MIKLIDHTLDEALHRLANPDSLDVIGQTLQRYNIELFDIHVENLHHCPGRLAHGAWQERIRCLVRPEAADLEAARSLGFGRVAVLWRHSSGGMLLPRLEAALKAAAASAEEIYLYAAGHSLSDPGQFQTYWPLIDRYGVKRLIYFDHTSLLGPLGTRSFLTGLKAEATCPLEYCSSNVLGLAAGNSLAALKSGVEHIGVSVAGTSPMAAAMEEILLAVKVLWQAGDVPDVSALGRDCEVVLKAMNLAVRMDKPVIGRYVFAHESGIHVDGIAKNPELYEKIRPEEVGLNRRLLIGKHSGTAALKGKLAEWGLQLDLNETAQLLESVRELSNQLRRALSDNELRELHNARFHMPKTEH